jgi:hypothetical protein
MAETLFFVSKRLQRVAAAVICLVLAQAAIAASAAPTDASPTVRVSISR